MGRARLLFATLVAAGACGPFSDGSLEAVDAGACADLECGRYGCDARFGTCFTGCRSGAECAGAHVCQNGRCVGTECTASDAAARCGPYPCVFGTCATDCGLGPCADGFYCRSDTRKCVPRCTTRGDAVCGGYACDVASGECEPYCLDGELSCAAGFACDAAKQCTQELSAPPCSTGCGAYACIDGRCATHCVEGDDCAAPATCVAGKCTTG